MYIICFNSNVVTVALDGARICLYSLLYIEEANIYLIVRQIDFNKVKCLAIGDTSSTKSGMRVKFISNNVVFKFHRHLLGKVLDPRLNIITGSQDFDLKNEDVFEVDIFKTIINNFYDVDSTIKLNITGIKAIDFFCPYIYGGKIGIIGGAGVGKTTIIAELMNNIDPKNTYTIFAGVGERVREGHAFYNDMLKYKLINKDRPFDSKVIIIFGNMDQQPIIRLMAALTGTALANKIQERGNNVLLFIDNIFRYIQANSEISTSLNLKSSDMGYQPDLYHCISLLQERIFTKINSNSVTSVQAIYIPSDDMFDPASIACTRHMDSSLFLDRIVASMGIFPAVNPLMSKSSALIASVVGDKHFILHRRAIRQLERYSELQNTVNIIGFDNLNEEDQTIYKQAKLIQSYLSQPFFVSEVFSYIKGVYVEINDTIIGIEMILSGVYDDVHETELRMRGKIN